MTWKEANQQCKEATGFYARDIANPLLIESLDPHGKADYDAAAAVLADLIGSTGDMNSRNAAAALVYKMRQVGVTIEAPDHLGLYQKDPRRQP